MKKILFAVLASLVCLSTQAATTAIIAKDVTALGNNLPIYQRDNRLQVINFPQAAMFSYALISTATTLTEAKAATATGVSYYITDINVYGVVASTATADQQINLYYGTGTNCGTGTTLAYSCIQGATAGCTVNLVTPIKIPAAKALCFISAATGTKAINLSGYTAP
jgi:bacterioferritin-associated ferredoxin